MKRAREAEGAVREACASDTAGGTVEAEGTVNAVGAGAGGGAGAGAGASACTAAGVGFAAGAGAGAGAATDVFHSNYDFGRSWCVDDDDDII